MNKSNKQRRAELKARRLARAVSLRVHDVRGIAPGVQSGVVPADPAKLAHNNTYGPLPLFYVDAAFTCRDCGSQEVWTAKQQKWWYEEAQGPIDSRAVRCRPCRLTERARVTEARRIAEEGQARKRALKADNGNNNT
ncbi:MAG: zinc-ribbon domain-containing protein [Rhizobacter sp.]|nr:zinc-ribbon domain-containing protein [Rhizobacter sp.]